MFNAIKPLRHTIFILPFPEFAIMTYIQTVLEMHHLRMMKDWSPKLNKMDVLLAQIPIPADLNCNVYGPIVNRPVLEFSFEMVSCVCHTDSTIENISLSSRIALFTEVYIVFHV